ncbi:unnamed protein product, partial [Ectocarpus fasciculatus]
MDILCQFYLNGDLVTITQPFPPSLLLLDYLLNETPYTGTKYGCGEGGCGACSVLIKGNKRLEDEFRVINACLRPLAACHGLHIITVEGLPHDNETELELPTSSTGAAENLRFAPPGTVNKVAYTIAANGGTQCGFCTPGFTMSLNSSCGDCPQTEEVLGDIEDIYSGHICRCTGYRGLLLAAKKELLPASNRQLTHELSETPDNVIDVEANSYSMGSIHILHPPHPTPMVELNGSKKWFNADTWDRAKELVADAIAANVSYKLVRGNTSAGVYKDEEWLNVDRFINLNHIATTSAPVEITDRGLRLSPECTINNLTSFISNHREKYIESEALLSLLRRVAGNQVRNAGTVFGSISMAIKHGFLSDTFLGLVTGNTTVLVDFYENNTWSERPGALLFDLTTWQNQHFIIRSVVLPLRVIESSDLFVHCFKVARRLQNAHSLVNLGCRVERVDGIWKSTLFLGNFLTTGYLRLRSDDNEADEDTDLDGERVVSAHRIGRIFDDIVNMDRDSLQSRVSIAAGLFLKTILRFLHERRAITLTDLESITSNVYGEKRLSYAHGKQAYRVNEMSFPVSEPMIKTTAVHQAMGSTKYTRTKQVPEGGVHATFFLSTKATGLLLWNEAEVARFSYVAADRIFREYGIRIDDSNFSLFRAIDLRGPNPQGYYPTNDANLLSSSSYQSFHEFLLADVEVVYYGQPIGILATPFQWCTEYLVKLLDRGDFGLVSYGSSYSPVLTLDGPSAIPVTSRVPGTNEISSVMVNRRFNTVDQGDSEPPRIDFDEYRNDSHVVVEGMHEVGSQYHFYMETQCATPQLQMVVTASTQSTISVSESCSSVLTKICGGHSPYKDVVVKVPSLGGGFGGKEPQSKLVAIAATFVAHKLNKPCKFVLDRTTDMKMIGKRHPYRGIYKIAAERATGKICAMSMQYQSDAGVSYDCSLPVMDLSLLSAFNAYHIEKFVCRGDCFFTNRPTSTAFRSFGVIQAHQITEAAISHLCRVICTGGLNSFSVRKINFFEWRPRDTDDAQLAPTPFGQPVRTCNMDGVWASLSRRLCEKFRLTSQESVRPVSDFNQKHKYIKQGFSMLPLMYGISFTSISMNVMLATMTVRADGLVHIQSLGVEMGQGLETKLLQIASAALGIKTHRIRVDSMDGNNVSTVPSPEEQARGHNSYPGTGASTGTDLNGRAIMALKPEWERKLISFCGDRGLQGDPFVVVDENWVDFVAWLLDGSDKITLRAEYDMDNLLTSMNGKIEQGSPFYYFNYAAAMTRVQLDCLTGEWNILDADIVYDAGFSINSAIDIGQIEGGFMQGVGFVSSEEVQYVLNPADIDHGKLISDGTWTYKPPSTTEFPEQLNIFLAVRFRDKSVNQDDMLDSFGVYSSKTTGEPPLVLGNTLFFALENCIEEFHNGQ